MASIRGLLDGTNFEWFRDEVQRNLAVARKAWDGRAGEVVMLEEHARETLDRVADEVLG